ncbi:glycosyltransferase [Azospirillum sp. CT11-132]|uniref:glycosyltransferase n=1 Tax=Azospirillum sp. CT11-132 TaxID=3396317 RepID=UPI0039A76B20
MYIERSYPISIHTGGTGGHAGVTSSVVRGLRAIGQNFVLDPDPAIESSQYVWVLAGVDRLRELVSLRSSIGIRRLVAGPNIAVLPTEYDGILCHHGVDTCVVPSQWVADYHLEMSPSLRGRISLWMCGVDHNHWAPSSDNAKGFVTIYQKSVADESVSQIVRILLDAKYIPVIVNYGSYTADQFKAALEISDFAIFLSRSESQGLALTEAWSMNVPTLVWDIGSWEYLGHTAPSTSCPYLTDLTGIRWRGLNVLTELVNDFKDYSHKFRPRSWVLEHATDEICARSMLKILGG